MNKLKSSTAAKCAAYLLLVFFGITAWLSVFGVWAVLESQMLFPEEFSSFLEDCSDESHNVLTMLYPFRYAMFIFLAVSLILVVVCFVFLVAAAGHHREKEGLCPGWMTGIPLELFVFALMLLVSLVVIPSEFFYYSSNEWSFLLYLTLAILPVSLVSFTAFAADLKIRICLGSVWKNTLICRILVLTGRVFRLTKGSFKLTVKPFKLAAKCLNRLVASLPLIWKTVIFLLVFSCLDLWSITAYIDHRVIYYVVKILLLIPLVLYTALVLRKLQESGRELANGNLSYHTDTRYFLWDFKEHGENLNSIACGMAKAVDERLKSERFKTELITNVSHDIKTPLTSIINYSDLIAREDCDNERIREYADTLHRQSERLKKLINDLMEASKASTGNVDILLTPLECDVLITQMTGEYEERLKQQELTLVVKQPEEHLRIMADSRQLWRVFDNLMNNICKYAQGGTRVYLTLEKADDKAVFSLKNTSRYALDISSDELMERFVRGDRSRNTEGSGLGLSIAQSLTQLQKGSFSLVIDGDLFKVVLEFPVV